MIEIYAMVWVVYFLLLMIPNNYSFVGTPDARFMSEPPDAFYLLVFFSESNTNIVHDVSLNSAYIYGTTQILLSDYVEYGPTGYFLDTPKWTSFGSEILPASHYDKSLVLSRQYVIDEAKKIIDENWTNIEFRDEENEVSQCNTNCN